MGNPFRRGKRRECKKRVFDVDDGGMRESFVVEHREKEQLGRFSTDENERRLLWLQIASCGGFAVVELCRSQFSSKTSLQLPRTGAPPAVFWAQSECSGVSVGTLVDQPNSELHKGPAAKKSTLERSATTEPLRCP